MTKLCVECNWLKKQDGFITKWISPIIYECTHPIVSPPPATSLVNGKKPPQIYKSCGFARQDGFMGCKDGRCCPEGRFWEPKRAGGA